MLVRATGEMPNAHPTLLVLNVNIFGAVRNGLESALAQKTKDCEI